MIDSTIYQSIRREVDAIALVDTHEHLISEPTRLGQSVDLSSWLAHYASSDLVSAGMSRGALLRAQEPAVPLDERWFLIEPYWGHARTTGYGRALLLAARDLFDVEEISRATYRDLSARIAATNHPGWYEHVLKERANIAVSVLDRLEHVDPTPLAEIDRHFFAPVWRANDFILLSGPADLRKLEAAGDRRIHSLEDLLEALDHAVEGAVAAGVVGIKVSVAYSRSLAFEKIARSDAERVFNQLAKYPPPLSSSPQQPPVSWEEARPLQDYMMHQVVRRAIEHGLPIQVHAGLQEGNGNFLANSHPLHLVNLLVEYPEVRFDLFHAGYPYQSEMATLGKNFPNAFVDLCWVHVISPWVARQTLHEWLETVPANKIFAFGGDYKFVEGAYAHAVIARDNVSRVLAEKVESGYLAEDEAVVLARKMLRDNAAQFFCLAV